MPGLVTKGIQAVWQALLRLPYTRLIIVICAPWIACPKQTWLRIAADGRNAVEVVSILIS